MEDPWGPLARKPNIIPVPQPKRGIVPKEVVDGLQVGSPIHPLSTVPHAHTHGYTPNHTHTIVCFATWKKFIL